MIKIRFRICLQSYMIQHRSFIQITSFDSILKSSISKKGKESIISKSKIRLIWFPTMIRKLQVSQNPNSVHKSILAQLILEIVQNISIRPNSTESNIQQQRMLYAVRECIEFRFRGFCWKLSQ